MDEMGMISPASAVLGSVRSDLIIKSANRIGAGSRVDFRNDNKSETPLFFKI